MPRCACPTLLQFRQLLLATPDDPVEPIDFEHFRFGQFLFGNSSIRVEVLRHGVEFQVITMKERPG